jgi:hypothetical protein
MFAAGVGPLRVALLLRSGTHSHGKKLIYS